MNRIRGLITASLILAMSALVTSCSGETDEANIDQGTPTTKSPIGNAQSINSVSANAKTATTANHNWPRFRGSTGMGTSLAKKLPVSWSQDENVVWKSPLPGAGASSPIVFGDHIYLTCYTGYFVPGEPDGSREKLERHLLCLNRGDGKLLWKKTEKAKLPEEERIRDHGFAANTPAADSDRVYTFFGKSGVFAHDHNGKQLWHADVGSNTHGWGTAASPVLHKDLVYINASVESESLIALDRRTGKEKWRASGIKESWNTPLVVKTKEGKEELVVAIHGKVLGIDPDSGKELWSCATDIKWYMVPCVVAADGIVYALGGRSGVAALAVRTGGRGDVTNSHRLWTSMDGSNVTSPVYHEGHLYWMHESKGYAYCAKADTGDVVYKERIGRGGQIYACALLSNGRVYYLNRSGRTFVVAAKPKFELLSTNELRDGGQFNASPAVTDDRILIRSDKFLYCVGK